MRNETLEGLESRWSTSVRNGEAAVDGPARAGRSFPRSFHLALLSLTGVDLLDDVPDLACKDNTRQRYVDGGEATHNRSIVGSSSRWGR